jgi:hypothetical protein
MDRCAVHSITPRQIKSTARRETRFTATRIPRSDCGKLRAVPDPDTTGCCFNWHQCIHSYPLPSPTIGKYKLKCLHKLNSVPSTSIFRKMRPSAKGRRRLPKLSTCVTCSDRISTQRANTIFVSKQEKMGDS